MSVSKKQLKTCKKGHKYYKSSDCPTCPVCENERKPEKGFLALLGAPARRALENEGIRTLKKLAGYSEKDLLNLHGMGPSSIPKLQLALKNAGMKFKENDSSKAESKPSDVKEVESFIKKLDAEIAGTVQQIRKTILGAHADVGERIKWNHPSFYYTGEMKPFDPKEYKREIAVFNLHKGRIMLVMPSGAKAGDTTGLLEGDYKDGRRIITFKDGDDFKLKEKALKTVIQKWVKKTETEKK